MRRRFDKEKIKIEPGTVFSLAMLLFYAKNQVLIRLIEFEGPKVVLKTKKASSGRLFASHERSNLKLKALENRLVSCVFSF